MNTNTTTTAASGAASLGPMNDRAIVDAIRSAYDLGYRDGAHGGASAAHQVERDHGGALIHTLSRAPAAPAAQEAEPAGPTRLLADPERREAARQDGKLASVWRNRVAGLIEDFAPDATAQYLADRIVSELYDLPPVGVPRPQADAGAPETPEGCTPADARMLRQANHDLAAESFELQQALRGIVAQAGGALARFDIAAAPQAPAAPTAAAGAYAPLPKPYSAAAALGLDDLYTGDDMRAYADAHRAAPAPAAGAQDMESVLIDGVAYQTPAPVAAELLRLHLEAMEAPAAGAAPIGTITQPYTVAEIRERVASGDYSAELMLQHALLHLGAGAAPTDAAPPLLSPAEQKWLLDDPTAIRSLMTAIDVNYSAHRSMSEPGEVEPWPPKRWTELRELGRAIIAVDPECFDEQTLRDFGFPVPARAAAPAQESEDGWMPIETAPDGERVLLGPRHAPVVGTVHQPAHWHEEQEPTSTVVHYNGTTLVAGYRCSEWRRLPGAGRARQEGGAA